MKNLQEASSELMENLIFALNHSIDLKKDGVDPMIPFLIVMKGDKKEIKALFGDTPDYADIRFEKTITESDPDIVIYASDSYLTTDGKKYDAVLFKAYEKNDSEIYLVGQKFIPKTETGDFEQVGNPGYLGTIPNFYIVNSAVTKNKTEDVIKKKSRWKF